MAWVCGGLLFSSLWFFAGIEVATGVSLHHLVALLVHDELSHGRLRLLGASPRSYHAQRHHGNPEEHFSIVLAEISEGTKELFFNSF
jgi:hypothetical protein